MPSRHQFQDDYIELIKRTATRSPCTVTIRFSSLEIANTVISFAKTFRQCLDATINSKDT